MYVYNISEIGSILIHTCYSIFPVPKVHLPWVLTVFSVDFHPPIQALNPQYHHKTCSLVSVCPASASRALIPHRWGYLNRYFQCPTLTLDNPSSGRSLLAHQAHQANVIAWRHAVLPGGISPFCSVGRVLALCSISTLDLNDKWYSLDPERYAGLSSQCALGKSRYPLEDSALGFCLGRCWQHHDTGNRDPGGQQSPWIWWEILSLSISVRLNGNEYAGYGILCSRDKRSWRPRLPDRSRP